MIGNFETQFASQRGKVCDKWERYIDVYEDELSRFKTKVGLRLLEIGTQNGGSLEVFSRYFEEVEILIGCDINPLCANLEYDDPKIQVVVGDIALASTRSAVLTKAEEFDIIIDDGSHKSKDIINTFCFMFPQLKPGGIYIIEDLHCSYWNRFTGGIYHPFSSIAFFKKVVDFIHQEHFGISTDSSDFFKVFKENLASDISLVAFEDIYSVRFFNSVCVVEKRSGKGRLGARRVLGSEAIVDKMALIPSSPLRDESGNVYSNSSLEDAVLALTRDLQILKGKVGLN